MTDEQIRNERARRERDRQRLVRNLNMPDTESLLKLRHRNELMTYRREHACRCRALENEIQGDDSV